MDVLGDGLGLSCRKERASPIAFQCLSIWISFGLFGIFNAVKFFVSIKKDIILLFLLNLTYASFGHVILSGKQSPQDSKCCCFCCLWICFL